MNRAIRKLSFCFLSCLILWLAGLFWFIAKIPKEPTSDSRKTDAIVALTGGSNRLEYGLELLTEGKGSKLFVSGVHDTTTEESMLRHSSGSVREKIASLPADSIVLGHEAENTIGNAEETSRWLKKEGYHSIRLVTANYHMPRSLEEFTHTLPDILIIPEPVFPDFFTLAGWWERGEARNLIFLEYHKFLASKLRHWFVSVTHPA